MHERVWSSALVWALLLVSGPLRAQEAGAAPLFRQITVSTGKVIALGEPFDPAGLAESVGGRVYALRPHKFAGAEKLLVEVSAEGKVTEMQFVYREDVSFDEVVRRYRPRFGQPHAWADAGQEVGVCWDDGHTRLEIRRPGASMPAVSARLLQIQRMTRGGFGDAVQAE